MCSQEWAKLEAEDGNGPGTADSTALMAMVSGVDDPKAKVAVSKMPGYDMVSPLVKLNMQRKLVDTLTSQKQKRGLKDAIKSNLGSIGMRLLENRASSAVKEKIKCDKKHKKRERDKKMNARLGKRRRKEVDAVGHSEEEDEDGDEEDEEDEEDSKKVKAT